MAVVADAERQEVAAVAENALVVAEDLADKVDALTLRDNIADAFDNRIISSRASVLLFAFFNHDFLVLPHDANHLFLDISQLLFVLFFNRFGFAVVTRVLIFVFRLNFLDNFFCLFGEGFKFAR